jgi:hypothetical protein
MFAKQFRVRSCGVTLIRKRGQFLAAGGAGARVGEKWGRRVRNLVSEHGSMLRLNLSSDSQAAGRWALTSGGEYYAAGVGVGIAGFRAGRGATACPRGQAE